MTEDRNNRHRYWSAIRHFFWSEAADEGFGQSMMDDLRFIARFRAFRRMPVSWRTPSQDETVHYDTHPVIGRFGDMHGIASVGTTIWIARERMWYGWPDPPHFAFFALDAAGQITCGRDFNDWPAAWSLLDTGGPATELHPTDRGTP